MSNTQLTPKQELAVRRAANRFIGDVCRGDISFQEAMNRLRITKKQAQAPVPEEQPTPTDPVHARVIQVGELFKSIGVCARVYHPNVTPEVLKESANRGYGLYFMPAATDVSFNDLLRLAGAEGHWTAGKGAPEDLPVLEERAEGYWFWAETQRNAGHRTNRPMSWESFMEKTNLLSLEEYLVLLGFRKKVAKALIDVETSCWLRTMTHGHRPMLIGISPDGTIGINPSHEPKEMVCDVGARGVWAVETISTAPESEGTQEPESPEPAKGEGEPDQAIADIFGPESPDLTILDDAPQQ